MAHQRARPSAASLGNPHALSLKVLRLSPPSLATQTPLPPTHFANGLDIPVSASLAYPQPETSTKSSDDGGEIYSSFPLTPLLTLPPAFGAAYVGEQFTCTLCANNEAIPGDGRKVCDVRMTAELQTPENGAGVPIELVGADSEERREDQEEDGDGEFPPGATLQRTLRHELKEEGPHQLAVTVTYTESMAGLARPGHGRGDPDAGEAEGRTRTFRKIYQFAAQPLIAVRSKVTERRRGREASKGDRQWILEAQLENVGDASVVLERVWLSARDGVECAELNSRMDENASALKPQDIEQVMFMLTEKPGLRAEGGEDGSRTALAQVNVDWRAAMGEKGSLTTGWLAARAR